MEANGLETRMIVTVKTLETETFGTESQASPTSKLSLTRRRKNWSVGCWQRARCPENQSENTKNCILRLIPRQCKFDKVCRCILCGSKC